MAPTRRPSKKSTDERLVEGAGQLFFKHGIRRVTVDEICRGSGVSKMTFYRHFPDKTAVALKVLEGIVARMRRQLREVEMLDLPFEAKLQRILELKMDHARQYSKDFFRELLAGSDPALERYVSEEDHRSLQEVRNIFVIAQRMGDIRRDIKVDLLIHALDRMREALADEQLHGLYPDLPSLMQEVLDLFCYGALRR
ncbi:MAG: TetR/AcrR family transcriptional regulator [Elusimicrobia bacterium]|nr:TetR/AcrR family transcriptional regulator [Elusimicrobiota bacterium]